jgi:NDP-sugar pyrophosphorylase family protein
VTLVLKDEPPFNGVKVASDGRILGFSGGFEQHLAFTGIQVLERRVLAGIPAGTPSSIIDCYLQLIARGEKVMAHVVQDEFWRELGSLNGYLQMHEEFFRMSRTPVPGLQVDGKAVVHESARLGSGVHVDGMVCIGAGCALEHGVKIERSVIWEQVTIKSGCSVRDSVIGDGEVVSESQEGVVVGSEGRKELGTKH